MSWMDDYEPVETRLAQFWSEHPDGRVATSCPMKGSNPGDLVLFRCAIYKDAKDPVPWATGYAHQRILPAPPSGKYGKPNESAPEWTSPYEVCETSAIGRALANAGYAAKGRPSQEEVKKTEAANELFDISEWLETLNEEQAEKLKAWWKKTEGLNKYPAKAVPATWHNLIQDQITFLKESV
jgi:hypothetical protein